MTQSGNAASQPNKQSIDELISALLDPEVGKRKNAREALIRIGKPAVAALCEALGDARQHARWEAAKALAEIADPAAAPHLIVALDDDDVEVRWLAGEAMIALARGGLEPLLAQLTKQTHSEPFYEAAHHVVRELATGELASPLTRVLAAFRHLEPQVEVPVAAQKALEALRSD